MLSLLLAFLLSTAEVIVVDVPAKGSVDIAFRPVGKAELKRDGTVSHIKIDIDKVPPPASLGPALNALVVWTVSPEGMYENVGSLEIINGSGQLEATTRLVEFGILITAEPHFMVDRPNAMVVFQKQDPKGGNARRKTVPIEIGTYDYSKIQLRPQGALPTLIIQSRTAFQIALAAQADRLAESEFRQARVAIDTMEEMLTRSVPQELLEQSAHESIRHSQQAVTKARERTALVALDTAKNDLALRDREKQQLQTTIQQLTQRQLDLEAQLRSVQSSLSAAQLQNQDTARELDAVRAKLETTERSLADLQIKQKQLETAPPPF
jgi:hypothetical protein